MEKQLIKKTNLRTASKVIGIIDIVLASILLAGAIAMIVASIIITNKIAPYPASQVTEWATLASTLQLYGIILFVESPLMLAVSIVSLWLVKKSNSFAGMLTFGILDILIGGAAILGVLLIVVACIECYPNQNKKKQK